MLNDKKKCARCGEVKPITSFGKDKKRKDGLRCYCKPCASAIVIKWRLDNLDLEKERTQKRIWRQNNPDRASEIRKKWYQSNTELCKQLSKKWYYSNPDKVYAYHVKKYAADPEKYKLAASRWAKNNPEKVAAVRHKRRSQGGHFHSDHIIQLMIDQDGKCRYCHSDLTKYHIDHILPLALGGTSDPENIQLLCPKCNLKKGAKHPDEFERLINANT